MAREIIDGFDTYVTADIGLRWPSNADVTVVTTHPRTGTSCLLLGNTGRIQRPLSGNKSTVICGAAFYFSVIPLGEEPKFIYLFDSSTAQLTVAITSTGVLKVYRGATLLGSTSISVGFGAWVHIALEAVIHNTAGSYELRVNNVNQLSASGINTRSSSNNYCTEVCLGYISGNGLQNIYVDDLFVFNGDGAVNNTFPGDISVVNLPVNGNGSTQNFTPSTGSNNSANVDELAENGDTDYNSSSTVGHIDLYAFTNSAVSGVVCAQISAIARKDTGTIHHAAVCKSGATTSVGAVDTSVGSSYQSCLDSFDVDPNTGLAWTVSGLNAAEFGSKVLS